MRADFRTMIGCLQPPTVTRTTIVLSAADAGARLSVRMAYTMLELVIVLAIIGTLAAMAFPVLMRPFAKSDVQQAAQDLSRLVLSVRVRSMETGFEHRLRWRPGTGEYELFEIRDVVDDDPDPALPPTTSLPSRPSASRPSASRPSASRPSAPGDETIHRPYRVSKRLSQDVIFASEPPQTSIGPRPLAPPQAAIAAQAGEMPPQLPWSQPIAFFPDGRTSTAKWTLRSREAYLVDVTLRGLTGTIQVSTVRQDTQPLMGPDPANSPQPAVRPNNNPDAFSVAPADRQPEVIR